MDAKRLNGTEYLWSNVALPQDVSLPWTDDGVSFGQVYTMACDLQKQMHRHIGSDDTVLLAARDKTLLASAILASLWGGPKLLLPHSTSSSVLDVIWERGLCQACIGDEGQPLPKKAKRLETALHTKMSDPSLFKRDPAQVFLSLFTGGSTGRPQLWQKTPANLIGEAAYLKQRFQLTPDDVFLSTVPAVHIYGLLFSVLAPLLAGGKNLNQPASLPAEIARALGQDQPTILISSPPQVRALAASSFMAPRLRLAFSSGGMLGKKDADLFTSSCSRGIVEVYGSTETGGIATRCRADGELDWTPFEQVRTVVYQELLCVDSPFLSPELPRNKNGFYSTGDRADEAPSGRFVLYGRADGIVKVGGKRVDLDEIEGLILSLAGVQDACLLAIPTNSSRENELVALVVCSETVESVKSKIKDRLPPASWPRRIIKVDKLPATSVGKRDRPACVNMAAQLLEQEEP